MMNNMHSGSKLLLLVILLVVPLERISAHHSPAQYEPHIIVEKDAAVVRFDFQNPHSYILVRDSDNAEWWLETSSAVRLRREGWSADLFSPGDQISFHAHANRDLQKNRLYLNSVTVASGETYALLAEGDESPDTDAGAKTSSLAGIWRVDTENFDELFAGFENHPLTTKAQEAQAAFDEAMDPVADCIAYPTPQTVLVSFIYPMRIELSDDEVIFHHEFFNTKRTVYMDGRGHPANTARTNQGHAVGH